MYFVGEFVDTQSLDVIPEVWFFGPNKKKYLWPPKIWNSGKKVRAAKERQNPGKKWTVYGIRVISSPSGNRHYSKAAYFMKL